MGAATNCWAYLGCGKWFVCFCSVLFVCLFLNFQVGCLDANPFTITMDENLCICWHACIFVSVVED